MLTLQTLMGKKTPQVEYVADAETGDVHHLGCRYIEDASDRFLDLRTALVRGYTLCPHCCTTAPAAQRRPALVSLSGFANA